VHGRLAAPGAQARPGTDAIIALGLAALGWSSPPCQSTRQANSLQTLGAFPVSTSPSASHSPHSAPSVSALFFLPFSFLPLHHPPPPRAPSAFSPCAQYCCDFESILLLCLLLSLYRTWRCCFRQSSSAVYLDHRLASQPPFKVNCGTQPVGRR